MAEFVERIKVAESDQESVDRHRRGIADALADKYGDPPVRQVGSHARGTALRGASDADYFVIMPRAKFQRDGERIDSNKALEQVKGQMEGKYQRAEMVRDGQAISIEFSDGKADVVPAIYDGPVSDKNGYPVYLIPDGTGGWMRTSPDAHGKYLADANDRSKGKLKTVTLAVKKWREAHGLEAKSLWIELALAESGVCEQVGKSYPEVLRDSFQVLAKREAHTVEDPTSTSDPIRSARSEERRQTLRNASAVAATRAEKAVRAEERGDAVEAEKYWNMVFNQEFS